MASNRNVIKATKSLMSLATSYMTNMTRCVIRRPTMAAEVICHGYRVSAGL